MDQLLKFINNLNKAQRIAIVGGFAFFAVINYWIFDIFKYQS